VRQFGRPGDPRPTLVLANRSDIDLDREVTAPGATWLDYRLVERERRLLAMGGFGQEVRDTLAAWSEHLAAEGLAHRQGPRIVPQLNLLATLRRREVDAAGARLSTENGLPYTPAAGGEPIAGTYRQRLTLTSGRFARQRPGLCPRPVDAGARPPPRPRCRRPRQGEGRDRVEFRAPGSRFEPLLIFRSRPGVDRLASWTCSACSLSSKQTCARCSRSRSRLVPLHRGFDGLAEQRC
jgi:hypothetical protein